MPQSPALKLFRARTFWPLVTLMALVTAFAAFMASQERHEAREPKTTVTKNPWTAMGMTRDLGGTLLQAFERERVEVWVIVKEPLPAGSRTPLMRIELDGRRQEQQGAFHLLP
jgi:hypothetical protein